MTTQYLLIDEAAHLLRTPKATLYAWSSRGEGPPARKVGRRLLYDHAELIAWCDAQANSR